MYTLQRLNRAKQATAPGPWTSGVVLPGEVGILLIYVPNFLLKVVHPARDNRLVL